MSVSKALKSKGSSEPAAAVDGVAEDEDEEESAREASRAALPPFLYVGVVLLKKRVLGLEYAVVVATRVEGLEIATVSAVHSLRSEDGWRSIPEATLSRNRSFSRQQARTKQLC